MSIFCNSLTSVIRTKASTSLTGPVETNFSEISSKMRQFPLKKWVGNVIGKVAAILLGSHSMHYSGVIMGAMASQITSLAIVYSTVYLGAEQRKHQSSASLAFVRGFYRRLANSPDKWPVTRKKFPSDDVIMERLQIMSERPFHRPFYLRRLP